MGCRAGRIADGFKRWINELNPTPCIVYIPRLWPLPAVGEGDASTEDGE